MKDKCSYASKYKAIRKPTCGCKYCADLWEKKQHTIKGGKLWKFV